MYTVLVDRTTALHKHTISIILTLTRCLNSRLNVIMTYADLTICFSERPKLSVHLNHRQTYCVQKIWMYTIMQMPHQYIEITLWLSDMHESRLTVLINQGATRPRAAAHKISAQTVSRPSLCDRLSSGSCECARVVRRTAGSFICCPYLLVWQLSRSLLSQKFKSRST